MAISRTQAVSANATSVAIAAATAGDIIVVWAVNNSAATTPTLAAGFTSIVNGTGVQQAAYLAYKRAVGGETTSGTWTNATSVVCMVFRGCLATGSPFGATPTLNSGNSAALGYLAVTLQVTNGTSVHLGFGGAKSATAGMNGTPTGTAPNFTNRASQTLINGLDTAATATNLSAQTLNVTTSGRWMTATVELKMASLNAYTIPIVQGSYSLSGQATAFKRMTMPAVQGTYGLTGQPAGLLEGKRLRLIGTGGIDPGTVPGLKLWLKADALTDFPVSTWPDSSGGGRHATLGGGSVILKRDTLGGKPVVRFNNGWMALPTSITGAAPWTIFTVMRPTSGTLFMAGLGMAGGGAFPSPEDNTFGPYQHLTGGFYLSAGTMWNNPAAVDYAGFHIYTGTVIDLGTATWHTDGVAQGLSQIQAGTPAGVFNAIGRRNSQVSTGDLVEIIAYNVALSATDRANIEAGIAARLGLTAAGGTPVDPTTVTGLVGWWKADTIRPDDGYAVATLPDVSGNGHDFVSVGSPTYQAAGANGKPCVHCAPGTDYFQAAISQAQPDTIIAVYDYGCMLDGSSGRQQMGYAFSAPNFYAWCGGNPLNGGAQSVGVFRIQSVLWDGDNAKLWMDGTLMQAAYPGYNFTTGGLSGTVWIGNNFGNIWGLNFCELLIFDGALDDATRFGIEVGLASKWSTIPPAGGGNYALIGKAVTFPRGKGMPMGQGAYALAGQATGFLRSRIVGLVAGAYGLAGQAANMLRGRRAVLPQGAYGLGGFAAGFLRGRVIPTVTGSYGLAGKAVILARSRIAALIQGAYTLTGQPVGLSKIRQLFLAAAQGAFALAGQAAALFRTRNPATVTAGNYSLASQPVNLQRGRAAPLAQGPFVVTGQTLGLKTGHRGSIVTGAFNLAGQPASLRRTRIIIPAFATFTLAGQPANLKEGRGMIIVTGAFSVAGRPMGLLVARRLPAVSSFFNLNGQPINALRARRILAGPGFYALIGNTVVFISTASETWRFYAGSVTGSILSATGAASILHADQAASILTGVTTASILDTDIKSTGSAVTISLASSDLKVEKTE